MAQSTILGRSQLGAAHGQARQPCALAARPPAVTVRPTHARTLAPATPHAHTSAQVLGRAAQVAAAASSDTAVQQPSTSTGLKGVPQSSSWEIDFCSRPLLDERGKKVWELLICDPGRSFEYSEYFPNSKINSAELKRTIDKLLALPGAVKPEKARFFRSQMQTIITKALTDVQIKAVPSRRCFTVMAWISERLENVYKADPRYSDKAQSLFQLDLGPPEALPDALRGEQWAFVQLPLGQLLEMLTKIGNAEIFGSAFSLKTAGCEDFPMDILIPGVVVFSRRALPLSAWTNGLEIACVRADVQRSCLILETGVNQRWKYGSWKPNEDSIGEAEGWEIAKQGVKGLHFLAVQPDPDSDDLNGLWLLQDRPPPSI